MVAIRQIGGILLLALAALKVLGMASVLIQGATGREPVWFIKQTVYAAAAASVGLALLRYRNAEPNEPDKRPGEP